MSRWKLWGLKAVASLLALVVPFIYYILNRQFGDFNVFATGLFILIVAFFAALWWERRKRRLRGARRAGTRAG
jgi:hypothetical protein